jgi:hypothetical protein
MTTPTAPGQPDRAAQMEAATADLEHLQDLLRRAAQGQAGGSEVMEWVRHYRSDHGDALKAAAGALGEEVRGQMLDQLYRMREQVERQLQGQRSSVPQQPGSGTAPEQHDPG